MAAKPASNPGKDWEVISFPGWKPALAKVAVPPDEKTALEREIISFLRLCNVRHAPAWPTRHLKGAASLRPYTDTTSGGRRVAGEQPVQR